jgi:hypothetical protein
MQYINAYELDSSKENQMKKTKNSLRQDTVDSESFHVGIELELRIPGCDHSGHDDDSCYESRNEFMNSESDRDILINHFGLSRDEARAVEPYFNRDDWQSDYMSDWSCDDSDCPYKINDADSTREELEGQLKRLTGNTSFKVVADGSIETGNELIDAEVCWNYFASKSTLKDNEAIIKALKDADASFDKSCGLHINLNNYLKVPQVNIANSDLGFLFDFVAGSRRSNTYCNKWGMSSSEKYSMIYHQDDRLEFRFFSPTLEAEKLHHYVVLANTVYKRLAGKDAKLPKKTVKYFLNKLVNTNKHTPERAQRAIDQVNGIMAAESYANNSPAVEEELEEALPF